MRKNKVFYLVYGLTSGGIEKYSVNLFKYINKKKHKVDFIVKMEQKEFFDDLFYALGGKKIALSHGCTGNSIQRIIIYLRNLYVTLKDGYNIAYFNLSSPSAVFKYPLISRILGIKKIIIHSHNSYEEKVGIIKKIINFFGRICINWIAYARFACSDKAAKWMFGNRILKLKKYSLIANGIEVDQYTFNPSSRANLRKILGIHDNQFVIGHVGRFVEQKNHEFIIDIFYELLTIQKNALLLLIGIGPLKNSIEEKVLKLGIKQNVIFLGERADVNDYMQVMDIFLLPSFYEGLPVVGIEAQAAGLKCFFSNTITKEADVTGNVEFIGINEDAITWAKKIKSKFMYERKSQKKSIEQAGFDIQSTAHLVESVFEK